MGSPNIQYSKKTQIIAKSGIKFDKNNSQVSINSKPLSQVIRGNNFQYSNEMSSIASLGQYESNAKQQL